MRRVLFVLLAAASVAAQAQVKPCEELKGEIAQKLDAKGVVNYSLEIVANDMVADQQVVGSCDGGTNKITYARGAGVAAPAAEPAAETAPEAVTEPGSEAAADSVPGADGQ